MGQFTGKRALVIGGSKGIGAAIVDRLASDGAEVMFTYASSAEAAREVAERNHATAVLSDAADRDATIAAVSAAGALDILVYNAGIAKMGNPLKTDPDLVDRMLAINVHGAYHAIVEAARTMRDDGRIVVIGSVNGDRMPLPGGAAYGMTKAAVQGMARGFARDFGKRRITVNVVQPGPVDTDMNPADGPFAETLHGMMAIQRHATAAEVAELVAYLAGPHAAMITGTTHTIDGGLGI